MPENPGNGLHGEVQLLAVDNQFCVDCGMCCDGTLFKTVRIVHADKTTDLPEGFPMSKKTGHFDQPCTALKQAGCSIYSCRPRVCRDYDCGLLGRLKKGEITLEQATQTVEKTVKLRDLVLGELQYMFESNEGFRALELRFWDLQASLSNKTAFENACGTLKENTDTLAEQLNLHFINSAS